MVLQHRYEAPFVKPWEVQHGLLEEILEDLLGLGWSHIEVSIVMGYPQSWMVSRGKPYKKIYDLGLHPFWGTPKFRPFLFRPFYRPFGTSCRLALTKSLVCCTA